MSQKRPRRNRKAGALYAPVTFIIVCAVLVFGIGVFFRVSNIEVVGAAFYTPQEVIDASGIENGDNLFFINRFSAMSKINAKLPYVESVTVGRSLPNKVIIEIEEAAAAAYINSGGVYWLLDRDCRLLESTGASGLQGLISIIGLTPSNPVIGETLQLDTGDAGTVEYVSSLLSAMDEMSIIKSVSFIDLSNPSAPVFDYLDRFTVKPGRDEAVEYKLEMMLSAVSQLEATAEGVIDLSQDKKAHFSPY